ncbi:MAG: Arc family DNA binding domain-containing protein [Bacteroidetes bacterium]|nr:Arc family DNA binding domain-containing protein [Bacteroidota bacterium]
MSLTKKTFVLRINDETFSALSKWAEDEFRSVNGQIEMILDKALKDVGRKKMKTDLIKIKTNHNKVEK